MKMMMKIKKKWAIDSFITSYLKAFGGWGAIGSLGYSLKQELSGQLKEGQYGKDGSFLLAATSVSPPIQSRLRKLLKLKRNIVNNPDDLLDPTTEAFWKNAGYGLNVGANIPLDRAIQKIENLAIIAQQENGFWQESLIALGWSPWQLGIEGKKGKTKRSK